MTNQFLPASQLDFNSLKDDLKSFLKNQDRFKDYDFEGSNISILIELLAYNSYNQAHYLNMVGSEMFLDSSQLRESLVSHAKELNYLPRSRISARCNVSVEVTPTGSPANIVIPKYYAFKSTSSTANSVRFLTDQPVTIKRNSDGRYIADSVTIYEGSILTENYLVGATTTVDGSTSYSDRFWLKSANIDITSIEVTVGKNAPDPNPVTYTRASTLYGLDRNSLVYFIRGYKDNYYEIEFGDGILGAALSQGNFVTIKARDTIGADGNGTYTFSKTSAIDGWNTISISSLNRASGGAERETNEEIQYNAAKHYQVQERAVTASDYEQLIKESFPEIQEVNVFGGEEIFEYGKVIIVLKPFNIDGVVDNATKDRIIGFLKTKNIVPQPAIIDPEYYYLGITGNVYYNSSKTVERQAQIEAKITNALLALNLNELKDFNTTVYQSLINETVQEADTTITGSDVTLSLVKRWAPVTGVLTTFTFTTDNPIISSNQGEYTSVDNFGVSSSIFKTIYDDNVVDVALQDNGTGSLLMYIIQPGSVKVKIPQPVGTVDYVTGKVQVTMDVYDYNPYIAFNCKLIGDSIVVSKDKFVSIDTPHVNLGLNPK